MHAHVLASYVTNGLSSYAISKLEKVSQTTVRYWLKKHGLKTRHGYRDGVALSEWRKNEGYADAQKIDWAQVQRYYDAGNSQRATAAQFNIAVMTLRKAMDQGRVVKRSRQASRDIAARTALAANRKLTIEQKQVLSVKRKAYLARTERAPWQTSGYHKSIPCEKMKKAMRLSGLTPVEEHCPLKSEGRFYSIDISFPDIKLGIEINGRQHYDGQGDLLPYYQDRHTLITQAGWTLVEIPYARASSVVFTQDLIAWVKKMVQAGGVEPTTKTPI